MDTAELAPPLTGAWVTVAGGALLAVLALTADPGGRFLLLPAAALVVATGLRDLLLRPVLSLQAGGLVVVDGVRRVAVGYRQLEGARVVTDRRTPLLELDLGSTVVVLGRRRLGVPPSVALELLEERRAAGG